MAHVSIIGTGDLGQAIAAIASKGGNNVELIGQAAAGTQVAGGGFGLVDRPHLLPRRTTRLETSA